MSPHVPDVFIVGVQKAGTTTLAGLLARHPRVRLSSPKEPMFFCCDDASVHRNEFLASANPPWLGFDWRNDRDALLAEYDRRCFGLAGEGREGNPPAESVLRVDASTSYALSRKAAERIADLRPDARIIFILRDPVARAESAYWHIVRKGLSVARFDESVRFGGQNLLEFGHYEEQIRRYQELLGRDRVHVAHYEEFIRDSPAVCEGITRFLGLPPLADAGLGDLHLNRSYYPRSLQLQALGARFARSRGLLPTSTFIRDGNESQLSARNGVGPDSGTGNDGGDGDPGGGGFLRNAYRRLFMVHRKPGAISPRTRELLEIYYRRENAGLARLIDRDPFELWRWRETP